MTDEHFHESAYDGLLEDHHAPGDDSQWAFGTDFEDPLAGVDTTVPEGVDHQALAAYCLMLGDDALVYSHRLSEWCSRAPDLERDFRNVRLVEPDNGDFAVTIVRLLLFSTWRLALLQRLVASRDQVLSAIAAKGVKEVTYHRDYAGRWFLTLAQGTEESRRRLETALTVVWPMHDELFRSHGVEQAASTQRFGVDPATVADEVAVLLEQVFSVSGVERPEAKQVGPVNRGTGRDGRHTEAFGKLLAEMQVVARAHPRGQW
jgi:ring-1,2-phenylacetyl-CoA epoxidase subunit PaaC